MTSASASALQLSNFRLLIRSTTSYLSCTWAPVWRFFRIASDQAWLLRIEWNRVCAGLSSASPIAPQSRHRHTEPMAKPAGIGAYLGSLLRGIGGSFRGRWLLPQQGEQFGKRDHVQRLAARAGAVAGPVQRELQRPGGLSEPLPLGGVSLRDALVGVIRQDGDPATALGFPEAFPERFGLGFGEVTHGWRVVNGILGAVPIVSPLSRWPAHGCSRSRHETSPTAGMPSGQITVLPAVSPTGSPLTVTAGTGRGSG